MTPLLLCLIVFVLVVVIVFAAVRLGNLKHVDLHANGLKLFSFSFTVKGREVVPRPAPPKPKVRR